MILSPLRFASEPSTVRRSRSCWRRCPICTTSGCLPSVESGCAAVATIRLTRKNSRGGHATLLRRCRGGAQVVRQVVFRKPAPQHHSDSRPAARFWSCIPRIVRTPVSYPTRCTNAALFASAVHEEPTRQNREEKFPAVLDLGLPHKGALWGEAVRVFADLCKPGAGTKR